MSEQEKDFLEGMVEGDPEKAETPAPGKPESEKVEKPETPAPEAPTAPEPKKDETVPLAALRAEREKRQAMERQLRELQQKAEQEQRPGFFEAPEQYLQSLISQTQQQANNRLYAALEEQAREAFADYDEVFAEVEAHCAENPAAGAKILSAANPALAAYKFGKQLRDMKAMEDPAAYRAKLKAEILAELQKEQQAKEEAKRKAAEAIPPDLANNRSASGDSDVADDPFDKLF